MSTTRRFANMLNETAGQKLPREKGLRGMNFRSLSYGAGSKRAKPDQSMNAWVKMLKGAK